MSLDAMKAIYEDLKNIRMQNPIVRNPRPLVNHQSTPALSNPLGIRRTQSGTRSANYWKEAKCCCQQRVTETEQIRRKLAAENAELRRLCLYLDRQRKEAFSELSRLYAEPRAANSANCWYAENPCCSSSNCNYRNCCPTPMSNPPPTVPPHKPSEESNEIVNYIRVLEERIALLETKHTDHREFSPKNRRPIRSVSQQRSSTNSTSTPDFTLRAEPPQSSIPYSSSTSEAETVDSDDDEEEEENSTATTVYIAAHNSSNSSANISDLPTDTEENEGRAAFVRRFVSARERFLQSVLKKRLESPECGYAVIQRRPSAAERSESDDLPPRMRLAMPFTLNNADDGRRMAQKAA